MTFKPKFAMVPLAKLVPDVNVRRNLGDLSSLAESIRRNGVLEPLIGCPSEDGEHVAVLMGQRRLAACREVGCDPVPVVLRPRPPERERIIMQMAENVERRDMNPIDEAFAYMALQHQTMTLQQIAQAVHRSISHVSKRCRLLLLPDALVDAVAEGRVGPTLASEVSPALFVNNPSRVQKLEKLLADGGGEAHVRAWLRRTTRAKTVDRRRKHTVRNVDVPRRSFDRAEAGAKRARKTLRAWIGEAIEEKADREKVPA